MLKALFILEIFAFLSFLFGCVEKPFDEKAMVDFKIYDVTDCTTSNYLIYYPISEEVKAIKQWNLFS